jgi:cytochrome c oxidase assembly protein subunit 15
LQIADSRLRIVEPDRPKGLHGFAVFTACFTAFLLIAGALVTGNDAGLSVPDWPLSYGKLMPPMVGGIFYEHGHRMVATTTGILTIILAVWIQRVEKRRWMRRLGWAALGLVILQGVLGGITVLFMLPWRISTAHAALAQLFFCTTVSIALFTSPLWRRMPRRELAADTRRLALATFLAIFIQLLLGAAFRHQGIGIVSHVVGAVVATLFVFWTVSRVLLEYRGTPGIVPAAITLGSLLLAQLFLGGGSLAAKLYYQDYPQPMPVYVWVTTSHLLMGALTLGTSVILLLLLLRAAWIPQAAEKPVEVAA